eukprot:CAMPEP_0114225736 /NCGR_PEP_ID=MMETSP0058-20121206/835_1 /TAXON_ID=36894 /ORGANISM="Pyramimonas parkeae, CCMP726" /LENGTH=514 /DNA_ID=CAMNT_0001336369 /DNA_START=186 /DNA_END=1730 /DNA_ORIENTATION=+
MVKLWKPSARASRTRGSIRISFRHMVIFLGCAYLLALLPYVLTRSRRAAEPEQSSIVPSDLGYAIDTTRTIPEFRERLSEDDNTVVTPAIDDKAFPVDWFSECGCTGIEVESVNICVGLLPLFPGLRINRCPNRCKGPPAYLAAALRTLTSPRRAEARIVVVHIAYQGVCGLPNELSEFEGMAGEGVAPGQERPYLIARAMAEEDRIPEEAVQRCAQNFDEVWVPSHFNRAAFARSGVDSSKLFRIPETIDLRHYSRAAVRAPARLFPDQPLLGAFCDAFRNNSAVALYVKTSAYQGVHPYLEAKDFLEDKESVLGEAGDYAGARGGVLGEDEESYWTHLKEDAPAKRLLGADELMMQQFRSTLSFCGTTIVLDESKISTNSMPALYAGADAFVLPSHGEGWGLPLMEAMAMELPTIGTDFSGNKDFMNDHNSYLIRVEDMLEGPDGGQWANPSEQHLKELLQRVWEERDSDIQRRKIRLARQELNENYGDGRGITEVSSRLAAIVTQTRRKYH